MIAPINGFFNRSSRDGFARRGHEALPDLRGNERPEAPACRESSAGVLRTSRTGEGRMDKPNRQKEAHAPETPAGIDSLVPEQA